MKTYGIKIPPVFFHQTMEGLRMFVVLEYDEAYTVGDFLVLMEFDDRCPMDAEGHYTGHQLVAEITCISAFMQKPGWVIAGIRVSGL